MAEIGVVERESQFRESIAGKNELFVVLSARLNASKKTWENMEICLGYLILGAQNEDMPSLHRSKVGTNENI